MISHTATTSSSNLDHSVANGSLTQASARSLLAGQGYELVERFQHIHASRDKQEWHICCIADLPLLNAEQFLQRLQEATSLRRTWPQSESGLFLRKEREQ